MLHGLPPKACPLAVCSHYHYCYVKLCCRGKRCGHPGEIGAPSLESWLKSTHGLQMPSVNSFCHEGGCSLGQFAAGSKETRQEKRNALQSHSRILAESLDSAAS